MIHKKSNSTSKEGTLISDGINYGLLLFFFVNRQIGPLTVHFVVF